MTLEFKGMHDLACLVLNLTPERIPCKEAEDLSGESTDQRDIQKIFGKTSPRWGGAPCELQKRSHLSIPMAVCFLPSQSMIGKCPSPHFIITTLSQHYTSSFHSPSHPLSRNLQCLKCCSDIPSGRALEHDILQEHMHTTDLGALAKLHFPESVVSGIPP